MQNGDTKGTLNVSFFYKDNNFEATPEVSTAVPKVQ